MACSVASRPSSRRHSSAKRRMASSASVSRVARRHTSGTIASAVNPTTPAVSDVSTTPSATISTSITGQCEAARSTRLPNASA